LSYFGKGDNREKLGICLLPNLHPLDVD